MLNEAHETAATEPPVAPLDAWDRFDPWAQPVGPTVRDPETGRFAAWKPCSCCGYRCHSQLEFMHNIGKPWRMCAACDPGLDEPGHDTLCVCRKARGDANWELPDPTGRRFP